MSTEGVGRFGIGEDLERRLRAALEKLCKWRGVFAGWQLGTRAGNDPECRAVRDHREATMLLRAELNTIEALLLDKGVYLPRDFQKQLLDEAEHLDKSYEKVFPGISTGPVGPIYTAEAANTMKDWKP